VSETPTKELVKADEQLDELVHAVGDLSRSAIDRMLLTGERVTSAKEGKRLLTETAELEGMSDLVQKVVVVAVPLARALAPAARVTRLPWVMIASSAISTGLAVRMGIRQVQVIAALVSHRLEAAATGPVDPRLVEKLAVALYLDPKRTPRLDDDRLHLAKLSRKWLWSGIFGRNTSKRTDKALDAAERLDAHAALAAWAGRSTQRSPL
jgi:hypothetical protein